MSRATQIRGDVVGVACPFLVGNSCSIYENRPLVCRRHVSFYKTPKQCSPGTLLHTEVPMVAFSGIDQAFFETSTVQGNTILADIRDYFS